MKLKMITIIITCLTGVLLIGIFISLIASAVDQDEIDSSICKEQAVLLMPKIIKAITIYRQYQMGPNDQIIFKANTLFNITLQTVTFDNIELCNSGATHSIQYAHIF